MTQQLNIEVAGNLPPQQAPISDRFWRRVTKGDSCWEWTGYGNNKGYGLLFIGGKGGRYLTTHRVSWELHNGPIPSGLCVLHHCDNRRCVRPDHLFLGTFKDNTQDMMTKGRNRGGCPPGEAAPSAKLTAEIVCTIRAAHESGAANVDLARRYGVTRQSIRAIVVRDSWRHLA